MRSLSVSNVLIHLFTIRFFACILNLFNLSQFIILFPHNIYNTVPLLRLYANITIAIHCTYNKYNEGYNGVNIFLHRLKFSERVNLL